MDKLWHICKEGGCKVLNAFWQQCRSNDALRGSSTVYRGITLHAPSDVEMLVKSFTSLDTAYPISATTDVLRACNSFGTPLADPRASARAKLGYEVREKSCGVLCVFLDTPYCAVDEFNPFNSAEREVWIPSASYEVKYHSHVMSEVQTFMFKHSTHFDEHTGDT